MTGSGAVVDHAPSGSDSGRSSSAAHHPVDDPQVQQQQHYIPPQYSNMDPPSDGSQHSHYNPQQQQPPPPRYTGNEPPAWNQSQQQPQYPPPAGAPPPPAQQAYPPQAGPYPQHQQYQPQQYGSQHYQSQQQYGTGPYNNPSAPPSRPPPGRQYPQQQHPQQSAPPQGHASPLRYSTAVSPQLPSTPGLLRPELGPPVPWTSDIFGFLQDCHGCLVTILFPCITFGQIAEIMDTGYNSCFTAGIIYFGAMLVGVPCLYSHPYRTKMRRHFNLRPDPMEDRYVHFFCEFCALSQEYRELVYRGIDPGLGYAMQSNFITQAMDNPTRPSLAPPVPMNMMK